MTRAKHKKAKTAAKVSNRAIDNPFVTLAIVVVSVLLLIAGAQWMEYKPTDKDAMAGKSDDTPLADNAPLDKAQLEKVKIPAIKAKIKAAKDDKTLNTLLKELQKDSAEIVKACNGDKKAYQDLTNTLKAKKKTILNPPINKKEEPLKPDPIVEKPKGQLSAELLSFLQGKSFDLKEVNVMLQDKKGASSDVLRALETYKMICEHKNDCYHIIGELKKKADNSYFEKSDRLLEHKFKHKSIDDLEEDNWNLFNPQPQWMTATQVAEIERWWDKIEGELERLDEDY